MSLPDSATDDELIKDSLFQLVLTMNGERIMRPTFGTNALAFVFENNDEVLGNLLRSEIQGAVAKFEPRVQLLDIRTEQKKAEIILTLVYVVLATRQTGITSIPIPIS